jgi:hypothetical protein
METGKNYLTDLNKEEREFILALRDPVKGPLIKKVCGGLHK